MNHKIITYTTIYTPCQSKYVYRCSCRAWELTSLYRIFKVVPGLLRTTVGCLALGLFSRQQLVHCLCGSNSYHNLSQKSMVRGFRPSESRRRMPARTHNLAQVQIIHHLFSSFLIAVSNQTLGLQIAMPGFFTRTLPFTLTKSAAKYSCVVPSISAVCMKQMNIMILN